MQLAQVEETCLQVIQLGHGVCDGVHDGDSVLLGRGRGGALVLPVSEVGLRLRVDREQPGVQSARRNSERVEMKPPWNTEMVSYVPAEGVGTNFLLLGSQFAPEEPDYILVLWAETRHLEFARSNTTMMKTPPPRGGFYA